MSIFKARLARLAYQLQWIPTCCREMKWKTSRRHLMTIELFVEKWDLIDWWIFNLALVPLSVHSIAFDYAADTVQWVAKPKKKENLSDGSLWACSPFSTESVTQKHSKPKWLAINKSKNAARRVAQMKIIKNSALITLKTLFFLSCFHSLLSQSKHKIIQNNLRVIWWCCWPVSNCRTWPHRAATSDGERSEKAEMNLSYANGSERIMRKIHCGTRADVICEW